MERIKKRKNVLICLDATNNIRLHCWCCCSNTVFCCCCPAFHKLVYIMSMVIHIQLPFFLLFSWIISEIWNRALRSLKRNTIAFILYISEYWGKSMDFCKLRSDRWISVYFVIPYLPQLWGIVRVALLTYSTWGVIWFFPYEIAWNISKSNQIWQFYGHKWLFLHVWT